MYPRLVMAVAAVIALGCSNYAASSDLTCPASPQPSANDQSPEQSWIEASPYRVMEELDGWKITFVVKEATLQHRNIYCIKAPCPTGDAQLDVAVVIKNVSGGEKTLNFSSTQMMNVEVVNQNGETLTSLAMSRLYAAMLTELTLAAGEEKVLVDALVLDRAVAGDLNAIATVTSLDALPRLAMPILVHAAP